MFGAGGRRIWKNAYYCLSRSVPFRKGGASGRNPPCNIYKQGRAGNAGPHHGSVWSVSERFVGRDVSSHRPHSSSEIRKTPRLSVKFYHPRSRGRSKSVKNRCSPSSPESAQGPFSLCKCFEFHH